MPFCPREQTGSGSAPWASERTAGRGGSEAVPGTRSRTAPPERCSTLTNAPSATGLSCKRGKKRGTGRRGARDSSCHEQGRRRTQPRAGDSERSAGQQEQTGNEKKHQAGLIHRETTRNSHRALAEPQPAAQNRLIWIPDKRGNEGAGGNSRHCACGDAARTGSWSQGTRSPQAAPAAWLDPCSHLS